MPLINPACIGPCRPSPGTKIRD